MKHVLTTLLFLASCAPAQAEEDFDHGASAAVAQAEQMHRDYEMRYDQEQAQRQIAAQQQQIQAQRQEIQRFDNATPIERITGRY